MNSQVKRSMGKVWKHPKHRSWHRDVFTDPEALWILHFGDFYEGCIAYAWLIINSISSESLHLSGNSAPFLHCTKMIECRQSHVTPSANSVCVCLFSYNVKLLNVLSIFFFLIWKTWWFYHEQFSGDSYGLDELLTLKLLWELVYFFFFLIIDIEERKAVMIISRENKWSTGKYEKSEKPKHNQVKIALPPLLILYQ